LSVISINFYHAAAMQRGIAMSVCLSVRQTRALWQNESNFCQYCYTVWKVDSCCFTTRI